MNIYNRIPSLKDIAPVFGVIVLIVYTWMLIWFLNIIPAWMLFMTIPEILGVYLYPLAINLGESLFALGVLLTICIVLPPTWLRDQFIYRGTCLTLFGLGWMVVYEFSQHLDSSGASAEAAVKWLIPGLAIWIAVFWALEKVRVFNKTISAFAESSVILLYLYIPLSFLAIVGIVFRNIF